MNGWRLFFSWLYLVANIEGNFRKMCIVVAAGLIENVNLYVFTKVQVFLVDKVMNPESNEDDIPFGMNRRNGAVFVCGILATCTAVLHAVKFANLKVGLEGNLLKFIRANTFVKYLDFTASSREKIPPSRLVLIINEDCADVCKGVSGFLKFIQRLSRIGLLILFAVRNDHDSWWIATLILVLAILMALIRAPVKAPLEDKVEETQADLIDYIIDSMENYDLIVTSGGRQAVTDGLRAHLKKHQSAGSPIKRFNLNNAMMIEWGKFGFLAVYILSVLPAVLSKELTTGKFVAMVSVIRLLCSSCESLVDDLFECSVSFTPLKCMVKCLNLATEVPTVQKEARHRHKLMFQDNLVAGEPAKTSARTQLSPRQAREEGTSPGTSGFDLLGINMDDVSFSYPVGPSGQTTQLLYRVNLAVDQGSIVCIQSDDATCKRTMLQLLSQFRFPTGGMIFFPPHLRILYVMAQPLFFRDTLWKNLIFGCTRTPKADRVVDIVRKLKMPQTEATLRQEFKKMHTEGKLELPGNSALLRQLEQMQDVEELDEKSHIARLPGSELAKLNLCRGFITNPEVLIAHRPAAAFDTADQKAIIYNLLREHRDKRGLAMEDSRQQVHKRRPRTVFYTSQSNVGRDVADVCWVVHSTHNDGQAPFTVKQDMMRHA
jgi:ABC-type multidrug transport system fused ATPase/permease subunit